MIKPNSTQCLSSFYDYAKEVSHNGCYVKMLNGYRCFEDVVLTQKMVTKAIETMKQFLFVGIFEEYEPSLRVLIHKIQSHQQLPPSFARPHRVEVIKLRSAYNTCKPVLTQAFKKGQLFYHDPYDSTVYEEAKKLFAEQRQAYEALLPKP